MESTSTLDQPVLWFVSYGEKAGARSFLNYAAVFPGVRHEESRKERREALKRTREETDGQRTGRGQEAELENW